MPNHPTRLRAPHCVPRQTQDQELPSVFSLALSQGTALARCLLTSFPFAFLVGLSLCFFLEDRASAQIQWTQLPNQLTRGERVRIAGRVDLARLARPNASVVFRLQHNTGIRDLGEAHTNPQGDFSLWIEIPKDLPTQTLQMLVSLQVPPPSPSQSPPRSSPPQRRKQNPPPSPLPQRKQTPRDMPPHTKKTLKSQNSRPDSTEPKQRTDSTEPKQRTDSTEPKQRTDSTEPKQRPDSTEPKQRPDSTEPKNTNNAPNKDPALPNREGTPSNREQNNNDENPRPSDGSSGKPSAPSDKSSAPSSGTPNQNAPSSLRKSTPNADQDHAAQREQAQREQAQREQVRKQAVWERLKKGWRPEMEGADEPSQERSRSPQVFRLPEISSNPDASKRVPPSSPKRPMSSPYPKGSMPSPPVEPSSPSNPPSAPFPSPSQEHRSPSQEHRSPSQEHHPQEQPTPPSQETSPLPSSPQETSPTPSVPKETVPPQNASPQTKDDWRSRAAKWLKQQEERKKQGQPYDWRKEQQERAMQVEQMRRRLEQLRERLREQARREQSPYGEPQDPGRFRGFGPQGNPSDDSGGGSGGSGGSKPRMDGGSPREGSRGFLDDAPQNPRPSAPSDDLLPPLMLPRLQSKFSSPSESRGPMRARPKRGAPQNEGHQSAQRGQLLSRSNQNKMDTQTTGGRVFLRQVFKPYLPHHQRITALDQWDEGYHLTLRSERKRIVPAQSSSRFGYKTFVGHLRVLLWPGKWTPIPSVSPQATVLWARTVPHIRGLRFAKDSAEVLHLRAYTRKPQVVELHFALEADPLYFGGPIPKGIKPSQYPMSLRPSARSQKREHILAHLHEWGLSPEMTLDQILMVFVPYLRSFSARALRPEEHLEDSYLTLMRRRVGVCRHRAMLFVTTMLSIGYPARFVANGAHAFAEVGYPDGRWRLIDLGGGDIPNWLGKWDGQPFQHPEDPFPTPQVPENETREEQRQQAATPPIDTRPQQPDPRHLGIGGKHILRDPKDALRRRLSASPKPPVTPLRRKIIHHSPLSNRTNSHSPLQRRLQQLLQR